MIFISDFDPFDVKKIHYEIAQYVEGTNLKYDSGVHIHYFNNKVRDETFLSDLLQYLAHSDPENTSFGALSRQVNYHKIQSGGVGDMCKAVEEYAKKREEKGKIEGKIETVRNMLKDGLSMEKALKYADIDRLTYDKYVRDMR